MSSSTANQTDVFATLNSLQQQMRDPAVINDAAALEKLTQQYNDYVSQISDEMTQTNKYVLANLDKLESTASTAGKTPPSHTVLANQFNQMANLVSNNILSYKEMDDRTNAVEFWVAVLKKSLEKGDIVAVKAIHAALTCTPVMRMELTFEGLSDTAKKILESNELRLVTKTDDPNHLTFLHDLFAASKAAVPVHGIYKTLLDRADAKNEDSLKNEYVYILEQARVNYNSDPKLLTESSMTPFQRAMLTTPEKVKEQDDRQYKLSFEHEPRKKTAQASNLMKNPQLNKVINASSKIKVSDPDLNSFLKNSKKTDRSEERLHRYAKKYVPDYSYNKFHNNKKAFNRLGKSGKRAVLVETILYNCKKMQSDTARIAYLNGVIQEKKGGDLNISALSRHHKTLVGLRKSWRRKDTHAKKLLKKYRDALQLQSNMNKQNKVFFPNRQAITVTPAAQAQTIKYEEAPQPMSIVQPARRFAASASATTVDLLKPPEARTLEIKSVPAQAQATEKASKSGSVKDRINNWESMHKNQLFSHADKQIPTGVKVKDEVQAIESRGNKKR